MSFMSFLYNPLYPHSIKCKRWWVLKSYYIPIITTFNEALTLMTEDEVFPWDPTIPSIPFNPTRLTSFTRFLTIFKWNSEASAWALPGDSCGRACGELAGAIHGSVGAPRDDRRTFGLHERSVEVS